MGDHWKQLNRGKTASERATGYTLRGWLGGQCELIFRKLLLDLMHRVVGGCELRNGEEDGVYYSVQVT